MLASLPLVLGHGVAGVVSDVGPDVTGFELGDRIAAFGDPHHAPGYSVDGGFADKYVAEANGLMKLPDAKVRADERVGIIGLGGLGLTGARIAVLAGAQVYAADPKHDTWDLA